MNIKQTFWIDEDSLNFHRGKINGIQLMVGYFQKNKPRVIRQGKDLKMIKVTLSTPTNGDKK